MTKIPGYAAKGIIPSAKNCARTFKLSAVLLAAIFLSGCGPSDKTVARDFGEVFAEEIGADVTYTITDIVPGEAGTGYLYENVRFNIAAEASIAFDSGWFSGMTLREDDTLSGGEVYILYLGDSLLDGLLGIGWEMKQYDLVRRPHSPGRGQLSGPRARVFRRNEFYR